MMKKNHNNPIYLLIFLLAALFMTGWAAAVHAEEAVLPETGAVQDLDSSEIMDENAAALFALINAARRNPLETAASLGMDPQKILDSLPDMADVLTNGLPVLAFNERLRQTAVDHAEEMLAHGYYAYESLDGRTVARRLQDAGYAPVASGEAIGLIFFKNFISADRAVSQMFEKMFKDELSPEWTGPRNILNPDFKDLGVGFTGGLYQFDGMKGNVYLTVCDFGRSPEMYELQLLQLVNQLRARPAAVAADLGVDAAVVTEMYPELKPVFSNGLPPVRLNAPLYFSAEAKISDMIENGYFGYASPSGVTLGERIWDAGYRAEWAAETLARTPTCDGPVSPALTISRIFRQMAFNSLRTTGYRDPHFLSEKAVEAGFRVVAADSPALAGICGDDVHVTAGDFGAPLIKTGPVIAGIVFVDANGNDLYDVGEEAANAAVTIRAQGVGGVSQTVNTDMAGGYAVSVAPGLYCASVGEGEDLQFKWIQVDKANAWQVFEVAVDAAATDAE